MRKEIPLFITALVGVVLILQYFSPNKSINSVESTFMDWAQIVFAFSMILGILNLIRVNGDKIYKKRKNWGLSVIIIISFFITTIVGFANIGEESMYNKKILKTSLPVVNTIVKQVLAENNIKSTDKNYDAYVLALVAGTQKERTIDSLLPDSLKDSKDKYVDFLKKVRKLSKESIEVTNQMGRDLNHDIKSSLKKMRDEEFSSSLLTAYDGMNSIIKPFNKEFSLKTTGVITEDITSQITYILANPKVAPSSNNFTYYKVLKDVLNELNQFLSNDEDLYLALENNLKLSKSYNEFYKKSSTIFNLKKDTPYARLILSSSKPIYLNKIYRLKNNFSKESLTKLTKTIYNDLSTDDNFVTSLTGFIKSNLVKDFTAKFNQYVPKSKSYIEGNKLLKSDILTKIIYSQFIAQIITLKKDIITHKINEFLKNEVEYKKLISNKKIVTELANNSTAELEQIGLKKKNATFLINVLITGKYKLNTLEIGSSFMKIYDYIYVPLQATMFALLAFFVASASYRAFRARNKEATLLLVAGFIVMLGRVPVGEAFSIDGYLSFSQMSQFIMSVPAMSVQSGIMIGVALGVISTSLRLILGIERSHLGGD